MTATTISIFLGALIFLVAGISFLINILALITIWKGKFLKNAQSNIFIFIFATLAGNALQMAISAFYLGPSAIAQNFLFPAEHGGTGVVIISYLSVGQYYQEMFLQAIIAIDRVITIIFFTHTNIFTREIVILSTIGVYLGGFLLAVFVMFVIPCCQTYIYYKTYSFAYFGTLGFNYVDKYVDLPVNITSSLIAIVSYTILYFFIQIKLYKKKPSTISPTDYASQTSQMGFTRRKLKEIRYAIQFAAISGFVLLTWGSFRILPLIMPSNPPMELFAVIEFFWIFHSSSNAIIFMTMNSEFRSEFRKLFWCF